MKKCHALVVFLFLVSIAAVQAQQGGAQICTDDGLGLHLTEDGRAVCLSVDGRLIVAPDSPGGFVLADAEADLPASANMIHSPSVEEDRDGDGKPDGWTLAEDWAWDDTTAHSGRRSLKVNVSPDPTRSSGELALARFAVEPGRRYVYRFWAKTKDSGGRYPSCTYIRQYDADGKPCAPQRGVGTRQGTNDWFLVRADFRPTPQTRFIDIYANIYMSHGTCWYDDFSLVPADAAEEVVPLRIEEGEGRIEGHGVAREIDLRSTLRTEPGRIRADVQLMDLGKRDRRIVVGYDIPIAADGWMWWDNISMKRRIDTPEVYEWCIGTCLGAGKMTIYPFNSLSNDRYGLTLGMPLDQGPRIWVASYDNARKMFRIRFYLGLSQDTKKFPGRASFSFLLYRHDPRWGMRSAAKRFYDFYPQHFVKRFPFEGCLNYANIESLDDEGNMHMRGDVVVDGADFGESIPLFAHMHGGYACDFWPTDRTDAPSDDEVRQFLETHAKEIGEPENSYTPPSQILKQITYDDKGAIQFHRKDCLKAGAQYARPESGGWFFEFRVMEDPEVSDWVARRLDRQFKAWREKNPDLPPFHYCMSSDEIQGYTGTGGSRPDFRREHFEFEDIPLSFHGSSLALARINLMYDFLETFLWPHSEQHKYLVTGNANSFNRSCCFPYVDMGMIEWEWDRKNPLRTEVYARTMSYHKLYRFWRVCGNGEEDPASVVTHLHRCLSHALYPAVGGLQDTTHNLNDYRHLYRRYVPIVERLSASGWEPITHATAVPEGVLVERYGKFEDGSLHFSVRNITEGQMMDLEKPNPKTVTVAVDCKALGIGLGDKTLLCEELTDVEYLPVRMDGERLLIEMPIPNAATRVVWLSNRAGREAFSAVEEERGRTRILRFCRVGSMEDVAASPRAKNAVQLAKLKYRCAEGTYPAASDEKGIRVHVPGWPVVFRNRDATLRIALENIGDKPISDPKIALESPFDANAVRLTIAQAPAVIQPGERKEAVIGIRVGNEAARDIVPVCVTVADGLVRVMDVRVTELAPICQLLPERLSTVTEAQQLLLVMANSFGETIQGEVEIVPPKHIRIENAKHMATMDAGQSKRVTATVCVPEKQRDVTEKFRVRFTPTGGRAVETVHGLRVIGNRRRCKLAALDALPVIDGKPDDAAWGKAALLDDFRNPKNPVPATAATRVRAGQHGGSICFLIECDEPEVQTLRASVTELNGPVNSDDCMEFRFAPGHKKDILTFWVNVLGTRSSRATNDWEAAGTKRDSGYAIEVRIPLASISRDLPGPGEIWGFNILRHRTPGGGEITQWSQSNWTWGDPVFYGDLIFATQNP